MAALLSPAPLHRLNLLSLELDLLIAPASLPGFQDWLVTLCEFVTSFAIATSFFDAVELDTDAWLNAQLLIGALSSLWLASAAIVLLPRICTHCCCNSQLRMLQHPFFPATVQLIKLALFGAVIGHLTLRTSSSGTHTLAFKHDEKVVASVILAVCDVAVSINTIVSTLCRTDVAYQASKATSPQQRFRVANPRPRRRRVWIFVHLWKDYGMLSLIVHVSDVLLLLLLAGQILPTLVSMRYLHKQAITSQQRMYHVMRLLNISMSVIGIFIGTLPFSHGDSTYFVWTSYISTALLIVTCEVVFAICEVRNGDVAAATLVGTTVGPEGREVCSAVAA